MPCAYGVGDGLGGPGYTHAHLEGEQGGCNHPGLGAVDEAAGGEASKHIANGNGSGSATGLWESAQAGRAEDPAGLGGEASGGEQQRELCQRIEEGISERGADRLEEVLWFQAGGSPSTARVEATQGAHDFIPGEGVEGPIIVPRCRVSKALSRGMQALKRGVAG